MADLDREPSIDASYQVSVHLAKRFQRRRFLEIGQAEKKNCLWRLCLLTDRDNIFTVNRGPAINASYEVSVCLAKGLQGEVKM